jgi:hypothetical protein
VPSGLTQPESKTDRTATDKIKEFFVVFMFKILISCK